MKYDNFKDKKEEIKTKDKFVNLKNDYFLIKLFNNLERKRKLSFVKFNKNIKKRININNNDYKEFCETYSSIEIEIKPINNKYGVFIDIKEEDEKYYHIYFNNNKEEIKRNHINKDEQIAIIKIIIDYQVKSFENLFLKCDCVESINFKKFYRNNINNMCCMFFECKFLKELNLNNFNTNSVIDMRQMFMGCSSLKELNLNNFNTNNVTDMSGMFYGCSKLKELNINNFNTNNVTLMDCMFYECLSLEDLNLNNFNFNKVTIMNSMFYKCKLLKELNLNNFNTNNETHMYDMFYGCSNELIMKIKTQYQNIKNQAF